MSRLFTSTEQTHDLRPTIMSVSGLMLLLLPLTLVSTSLDKRTSLPIGLSGGEGERMLGEGPLEKLRVQRSPEGFVVQASVRGVIVCHAHGHPHKSVFFNDLGAKSY